LRIAFARNIAKLAKNNKGIISDHQYGRAHATCMTPVLNKLLTVQLLIQKRTEGIVFNNDVKGCYDRIISGVALASLRRLGYLKESFKLLGLLWAQTEHHVCTGFGVSDKTYGSTTEKLLYGIGQGSCASPILWALINQLLLAALGEKFTCIRLVAINGEEEHIRPGDSFLDHNTTGTTNDDSDLDPVSHVISDLTSSEESLIAKMEEIIQFFLDLPRSQEATLPLRNACDISSAILGKTESQDFSKNTAAIAASKSFQDQPTQNQESSGRPQPKDTVLWDSL
jgi:hypothetical protein